VRSALPVARVLPSGLNATEYTWPAWPGRVARAVPLARSSGIAPPPITKVLYVDPTNKVRRDAVDKLGFLFDE
jgi:hypothetical protein